MPKIKSEYPEGQRSAEMTLVEMLQEKRSWADYMEIANALWNLRYRAKLMKDEDKMLRSSASQCEAKCQETFSIEK